MYKLLLLSHGNMCLGMKDTLSIFTSNLENIAAIPFFTPDIDGASELDKFAAAVAPEDTVIVLTDILSGSVNQQALLKFQGKDNVHIVTGMNLPLALELMTCPSDTDHLEKSYLSGIVNQCRDSIALVEGASYSLFDGDE